MKGKWVIFSRVWKSIFAGWAPYLEKTVTADNLSLEMTRASLPSFGFFFMLGLATAIARIRSGGSALSIDGLTRDSAELIW